MNNNTGKYLKYAIGEIVLVVIGILIALSINNWNENRKKESQIDAIYTIIHQDLQTDLRIIQSTIQFYEELDAKLLDIMKTKYPTSFLDSINKDNYSNCIPCHGTHHIWEPFEIQNTGIQLLKTYDDNESIENHKLSHEIILFYTKQKQVLSTIQRYVSTKAFSNLESMEKFSWYTDYELNIYNPDAVAYFLNDQGYKNKAASYRHLTTHNYLSSLRNYVKLASQVINKIDTRNQ